jgi:hypothetical protein
VNGAPGKDRSCKLRRLVLGLGGIRHKEHRQVPATPRCGHQADGGKRPRQQEATPTELLTGDNPELAGGPSRLMRLSVAPSPPSQAAVSIISGWASSAPASGLAPTVDGAAAKASPRRPALPRCLRSSAKAVALGPRSPRPYDAAGRPRWAKRRFVAARTPCGMPVRPRAIRVNSVASRASTLLESPSLAKSGRASSDIKKFDRTAA